MGYNTHFTISMEGSDEAKAKAIAELRKIYQGPGFIIEEVTDDKKALNLLEYGFEAHWYDFGEDCHRIALAVPDVLIIVNGQGEDRDDIWEARYKGDLSELAKAVILDPQITDERLLGTSDSQSLPAGTVDKTLTIARNQLLSITRSGYIPFTSPAPSSTEKAVKQAILDALSSVRKAIETHESLYRKH